MMLRRTYGDGCPTAHALDLVGERWALLVVRELLLGPKRFTDLRAGMPRAGPNILTQRLRELEQAGIVQRHKLGHRSGSRVYELTEWGKDLEPVLVQLGRWALRSPLWKPGLEISVDSLILAIYGNFDPGVDLDTTYLLSVNDDSFFMHVTDGRLDVTRGDVRAPDAVLRTDSATLAAVLLGEQRLIEAVMDGSLVVSGPNALLDPLLAAIALQNPAAMR